MNCKEIIKEHSGTPLLAAIKAEIDDMSADAASNIVMSSVASDIRRLRYLSGIKVGIDSVILKLESLEAHRDAKT